MILVISLRFARSLARRRSASTTEIHNRWGSRSSGPTETQAALSATPNDPKVQAAADRWSVPAGECSAGLLSGSSFQVLSRNRAGSLSPSVRVKVPKKEILGPPAPAPSPPRACRARGRRTRRARPRCRAGPR